MHVSLYVGEVIKGGRYDWSTDKYTPGPVVPKDNWKKEHTYYVIFAPGQEDEEERFKKEYKDVIIFESERARNMNYDDCGPRNKLYIFEV